MELNYFSPDNVFSCCEWMQFLQLAWWHTDWDGKILQIVLLLFFLLYPFIFSSCWGAWRSTRRSQRERWRFLFVFMYVAGNYLAYHLDCHPKATSSLVQRIHHLTNFLWPAGPWPFMTRSMVFPETAVTFKGDNLFSPCKISLDMYICCGLFSKNSKSCSINLCQAVM